MDILRDIQDPYPYFRGLICEIGIPAGGGAVRQAGPQARHLEGTFFIYLDSALLGIVNTPALRSAWRTLLGIAMSTLAFLLSFYYLARKLLDWDQFQLGLAPLIGGLFFFMGVLFVLIGLMGEYIGLLVTHIVKRPMVVEKERVNFKYNGQRRTSMMTRIEGYSIFREDLEHIALHLAAERASLDGARLLITGGHRLLRHLAAGRSALRYRERQAEGVRFGPEPRSVAITSPARPASRRARRRELDPWFGAGFRRRGAWSIQPHPACRIRVESGRRSDWALRHMTSAIAGTQRLIDMATTHRTEAFLVTTSGAVYGNPEKSIDGRFVEGPGSAADYATRSMSTANPSGYGDDAGGHVAAGGGSARSTPAASHSSGPTSRLTPIMRSAISCATRWRAGPIVVSGDGTPAQVLPLRREDLVGLADGDPRPRRERPAPTMSAASAPSRSASWPASSTAARADRPSSTSGRSRRRARRLRLPS